MKLGTIDEDFYIRAIDLARLLKITDNDIMRLARSAVLVRKADGKRSFLYPCFENVTRYTEYYRSEREQIHKTFLKAKTGREQAQQLRVEMENGRRSGELIDKQKLIERLTPIIVSYRETVLARADRLARELGRSKGHKAKVAKIKAADLDALHVLSDLFKAAGADNGNGA